MPSVEGLKAYTLNNFVEVYLQQNDARGLGFCPDIIQFYDRPNLFSLN